MKSSADTSHSTQNFWRLFSGSSQKLQRAWRGDTLRLHRLAVELAHQPEAVRQQRLDALEQWERLQVLDEIRHHVAD